MTAVGSPELGVAVGDRIQAALPHRETQLVDAAGQVPWSLLPAELPLERAALLQSATIALQAVQDAELVVGDRVAVFGLGAFGLMSVELARLAGASLVVAVDPVEERRELAARLGADWTLDPTCGRRGRRAQAARGPARGRRRRSSSPGATTRCTRRCEACGSPAGSSRPASTPAAAPTCGSARSGTTTG